MCWLSVHEPMCNHVQHLHAYMPIYKDFCSGMQTGAAKEKKVLQICGRFVRRCGTRRVYLSNVGLCEAQQERGDLAHVTELDLRFARSPKLEVAVADQPKLKNMRRGGRQVRGTEWYSKGRQAVSLFQAGCPYRRSGQAETREGQGAECYVSSKATCPARPGLGHCPGCLEGTAGLRAACS